MTNRFTVQTVEIKSRPLNQAIMVLVIGHLIRLVREVMIVLITNLHQVILIQEKIIAGQPIHLLHDLRHHRQRIAHQVNLVVLQTDRTIVQEANHLPIITVHPGVVLPDQVILQEAAVVVRPEAVAQATHPEAVLQEVHLPGAGDNQKT